MRPVSFLFSVLFLRHLICPFLKTISALAATSKKKSDEKLKSPPAKVSVSSYTNVFVSVGQWSSKRSGKWFWLRLDQSTKERGSIVLTSKMN